MLLTAAVMAGVGALVAINSFTDNIRVSLADQAQELLGADLAIRSRQALDTNTAAIALIDSIGALAPGEIRSAASASLPAMAYLQSSGTARLVQLRTVDPGWPFYGQITTEPAGVWPLLQSGGVVVDPSLLGALDAQIGDSLIIGEAPFAIVGTVINVPGEVGLQSAFGARAFIAHNQLASTGLVGFGTRIDHETFLKLPATVDAQDIAEANRESLREHRVRLRTVADDRDNLTDGLTRLGNYLGLVALAALLLGGLGTASAVHVLIRQRLDSIAMLRCLGASSGQVIGAHLLQAVVMGLIGSLAGVALGLMMQQLMPYIFADLLPVDVVVAVSPRAALLGIALGVWTAGIFALLPLLGIRFISPLATLRRNTDPPPARWDLLRGLALVALSASVVGLARVQVGSWREAFWFAVAAAIALVVLWLASLALISLARLFTWSRFPYLVRQGLANLHRPGNQTVTVVLALGFGAFLLTTLFTAQANLLRDFRFDETGERPNLVLVDVQPLPAAVQVF